MGSPSLAWSLRCTPSIVKRSGVASGTKQASITQFITATHSRPAIREGRTLVISLFDTTGTALTPWLKRGYSCIAYQHSDKPRERSDRTSGKMRTVVCDLNQPSTLASITTQHLDAVAFACASPPSKDLSVAGARHWKRKRDRDPNFQQRVVDLVANIERCFSEWDCPFYIANPATSQLGKLWRPPNFTYQPYEFGLHLSASDAHPLYPEYIPAQDAYTQHQGLWTGGGFRMPLPKPVTPTWKYFVSKRKSVGKRAGAAPVGMRRMSPILYSNWSARGARACTPRGFARALCERLHAQT